ncbi:hypothetical protein B0T14DRAFT_205569 [Immersiella caudata]|uniref:Uncharacterized protein n=1 Tax=Immersiella caudata TaxID=314043 RepID=A0AA40BZ45_9PEZI|nr:hypothetical protein B0T14DRAFT_205569 [Immersiella caudata]
MRAKVAKQEIQEQCVIRSQSCDVMGLYTTLAKPERGKPPLHNHRLPKPGPQTENTAASMPPKTPPIPGHANHPDHTKRFANLKRIIKHALERRTGPVAPANAMISVKAVCAHGASSRELSR